MVRDSEKDRNTRVNPIEVINLNAVENTENEEYIPELHTGTIAGVSSTFSGLQAVYFVERLPVHIENYGVRQLYRACQHLGQPNPAGMRIEFVMDDLMGMVMQSFQIIGNETHIACYKCQDIFSKEDESEYAICEQCGHTYCYPCEDEGCPFCKLKEEIEDD